MMLVKKAKEHCGYDPKPVFCICGNCAAFATGRVLPEWMEEWNKKHPEKPEHLYVVETHGVEKNLRCIDHGFPTKKQRRAVCIGERTNN